MKAVFLDRDGTLIKETPRERVTRVDELELFPDTVEALDLLRQNGFSIVIISNQAGISEGLINLDTFKTINDAMLELLAPSRASIIETFVCPHGPGDDCECRKPKPKLILDAAQKYDIDPASTFMIGDRLSDIEFGINAGTKTILVETGAGQVRTDRADYTAKSLLDAARYVVDHQS